MLPDDGDGPPDVPGYRVGRPLGQGASATVWRAEPVGGGRPVAVKVVCAGPLAERELAVLTAVRHPHVLALHDVVVLDDDRLALVVPLLEGGTLAELVAARGPLHPGEVVTCLAPLAQAIGDLHEQGIQHGDVAPGNVLLDGSGRPFLADLGTVRVTGEARAEVYGTPGYVDPVVLTGGEPSPASDVHGLGALAWFALTGSAPPGVPSRTALTGLVRSDVPAALVEVVEAAVAAEPACRPSAHELARRLHEATPASAVWRVGSAPSDGGLTRRIDVALRARATDPAPKHRRERRDHRRALGTAAAGLILMAAVAAVAAFAGVVSGSPRTSAPPAHVESPVTSSPSAAPAPSAQGAALPNAAGSSGRLDASSARAVVARACQRRAAALAAGAGSTETAPGSAVERADAAALAALRAGGLRYRALQLVPRSVRLVSQRAGWATLDVVVDASAYDVVDRSGHVLGHVAAAPGERSRLEVVRTRQGWRVASARTG